MTEADEPRKALVLVVDDDPTNRMVLAKMLRLRGFEVAEAGDGFEAVEQATDRAPTLVLMDIHMPRMTGVEAATRIARALEDPAPKIIAVTADNSSAQRAACEAAGFHGFLSKPIKLQTLYAELDRHSC